MLEANLGGGFLNQFKVIFDLPRDRIIPERHAGRRSLTSMIPAPHKGAVERRRLDEP